MCSKLSWAYWAKRKKNVRCLEYLKDVQKTVEAFDATYTGGALNLKSDQVESSAVENLHEFLKIQNFLKMV